MAPCNPLRETQEFDAKRDALRRAVSAIAAPTRREKWALRRLVRHTI
jgi:hypothetical protein